MLYQMQMLERYLADMMQREHTLSGMFREAVSTIESLKALKEKPQSDSLVPIGMGAFVKSQLSSNDNVIINIGGGVAMEKNLDSALNYLESRIKEIEIALQDTSAKKHDAANRLEQGKQEMNRLMQQQQPGQT